MNAAKEPFLRNSASNDERLHSLNELALFVEKRALVDYEFKRATGTLAQDLKFVSDALLRDAELWKLNRAFHAVHVPSFLTIMSMLENVYVDVGKR